MFVFELKISAILLNYPTFYSILSCAINRAIELLYIYVHNKKLIKSEKTVIQSMYALLGQNRVNDTFATSEPPKYFYVYFLLRT